MNNKNNIPHIQSFNEITPMFDNKKSISKQIENFVDKFHENFFL